MTGERVCMKVVVVVKMNMNKGLLWASEGERRLERRVRRTWNKP